ncbi:uncharacterized protein LOC132700114 [Cylas formicarius]|uniref:uncharacterized protein LOC132700114 n=1 Tax=Cylas formicarius TaxID=197179 RepID=UPI0029588F14|nr:uncharacterized protein LOC132700114 [Cylas formicarius]
MSSRCALALLFATCMCLGVDAIGLTEVLDIIKIAKDVGIALAKAWDIVDQHVDFSEVPIPIFDRTETKLFGRIGKINRKLDELAFKVDNSGSHSLNTLMHNLPERVRLELRLNDLLDYLTRVDTNFKRMENYAQHQKDFEKITLEDFAKSVVSHDASSIVNLVERIHAFVVPNARDITNTGIMELIARATEFSRNEPNVGYRTRKSKANMSPIIICFVIFVRTAVNGREPQKLLPVDHLRHEFLKLEEELWNFVVDAGDGTSSSKESKEPPELVLIRRYEIFGDYIKKFYDRDLTYGLESLDSVWAVQTAYADLRAIYALYEAFRRFQRQQTDVGRIPSPKQAWIDIADAVLNDPTNNVEDATSRIEEITTNDLLRAAAKEIEGDMICTAKQSPQQVLRGLYDAIALTELKGYAMVQFSYMLLRLYGNGNFTKEAQISRDRYERRTNDAMERVRDAMKNVSRVLWNCDPKKHVKGETYEEITNLIQGYVQNEVDLNPDATCRDNCAEYSYTKSHGCYQNLFCRQQRSCNGKIVNCRFYDSDMWICNSNPATGRRYEYIEYENGRVLGRKQGCARGTTKVDSWWRWLFWHCSYCFCFCDEQGPMSDRYFNMRPVFADIENNRVVTGLRFVKHNRIVHLQIQEAELLPRLNVNESTVQWKPPEDYKISDRKIFNGQDYHTLTWEKRAIDLDDLEVDDGYVFTGVRFKLIGSHLNFEIYMTKFDFDTGKLLNPTSSSVWKDNPNTDASVSNPRTKVRLQNPDVPTRIPTSSIPTSKSDQYVEFTHTDVDRDAAQTTVPFLDAQKVESLRPTPLAGAGIFHKGRPFSGGFVAPKIITYDVSKFLKAAFPSEQVKCVFLKEAYSLFTQKISKKTYGLLSLSRSLTRRVYRDVDRNGRQSLQNRREMMSSRLLMTLTAIGSLVICHGHLLVDQLRLDFIDLEEKLWNFVLTEASNKDPSGSELHLVTNFYGFDQKLKQVPENTLRDLGPIKSIGAFLHLYSELTHLDRLYGKFRQYHEERLNANDIESFDKASVRRRIDTDDIINDILNENHGANKTVHNIYDLSFGRENMVFEVFTLLLKNFSCQNPNQSPQQVYYNLYNVIALAGLKSYAMVQFAYLTNRLEEKGNYTTLSLLARSNFERRVNDTMSVFRGAMEIVPTEIWRCDPPYHIKGTTYEEITRLLQGHIQNEVDMNSGGTCTANCAAYPYTESHGCYDYESEYCRKMERCRGTLHGCRFIESHMKICISETHLRRYDYVEYKSGRTLGKKNQCGTRPVYSWYRWFVHCSYCMCLCDEQGPKSDRYVNMRPVMADVKNNRVVTGLRIVKRNRILHLQIQEGKLLPYGYIDNETVRWVPVDEYKLTDRGVLSGIDFATLTHEDRSLALDEVKVRNSDHVVTGVRFERLNGKLRFQINVSPFDFNNGSLLGNDYFIYDSSSDGRTRVDLENVDVPTLTSNPSPDRSGRDLYVEFTHTDFSKDAAQTTVPFFDIQPVFGVPAVPLSGAGIFYKGYKGYGGFVAPKILTYDYSDRILTSFRDVGTRDEVPSVVPPVN